MKSLTTDDCFTARMEAYMLVFRVFKLAHALTPSGQPLDNTSDKPKIDRVATYLYNTRHE